MSIVNADFSSNWRESNVSTKKSTFSAFSKKRVTIQFVPVVLPDGQWNPFTDWQKGLKCVLCKTTIRKVVSPYKVNCCNSIYCANCLYRHYFEDDNQTCIACNEYFNRDDDPDCQEKYEEWLQDQKQMYWDNMY